MVGVVLLLMLDAVLTGGEIQPPQTGIHPELRSPTIPRGLGVNDFPSEGTTQEQELKALRDSGMELVRTDLRWDLRETQKGEYAFSYDPILQKHLAENKRVLMIICYGNTLYGEFWQCPNSNDYREASAKYMQAAARHFKGKHIIWELWNEPNANTFNKGTDPENYMRWVKAIVPVMRAEDPNVCIIGPALSGCDSPFLEECLKRGLLDLVDGVSVHPYTLSNPETRIFQYARLRALFGRYTKKTIPLISSEWGYNMSAAPQQAAMMSRSWLVNIGSEIPISIWYKWAVCGEKLATDPDYEYALIRKGEKKMAYYAAKTLIDELRDFAFITRVSTASANDYLLLFKKGGHAKVVAWTAASPHKINLDSPLKIENLVNNDGTSTAADPRAANDLVLSNHPRYLTLREIPAVFRLEEKFGIRGCRYDVTAGANPNSEHAPRVVVAFENPLDVPVALTFLPVTGNGITGAWNLAAGQVVAPAKSIEAVWTGAVYGRDNTRMPLAVTAEVTVLAGKNKGQTYRLTRRDWMCLSSNLSAQMIWTDRGCLVEIRGTTDITGEIHPVIAGKHGQPVPFKSTQENHGEKFLLYQGDLAKGPIKIGYWLSDDKGNPLLDLEYKEFELVDNFSTRAIEDYKFEIGEGDAEKSSIKGTLTDSPGPDAPFPQAVKITYKKTAGWKEFFLRLASKEKLAITGRVEAVYMWIYAAGKVENDFPGCRFSDATGQVFHLSPDPAGMNWTGWKWVKYPLDETSGSWGGAGDNQVHWPLQWQTLYYQSAYDRAREKTTYITGIILMRAADVPAIF